MEPDCATEPDFSVLTGSHDNNVYHLNSEGKLIWKYTMNSAVYATPFIFSTRTCEKCRSKTAKLQQHADSITTDNPNSDAQNSQEHYVVCCGTQGQIEILDLLSGRSVCSYTVPGEVFSSPVVCGNKLIIGCRDDNVYCFQLQLSKSNAM